MIIFITIQGGCVASVATREERYHDDIVIVHDLDTAAVQEECVDTMDAIPLDKDHELVIAEQLPGVARKWLEGK